MSNVHRTRKDTMTEIKTDEKADPKATASKEQVEEGKDQTKKDEKPKPADNAAAPKNDNGTEPENKTDKDKSELAANAEKATADLRKTIDRTSPDMRKIADKASPEIRKIGEKASTYIKKAAENEGKNEKGEKAEKKPSAEEGKDHADAQNTKSANLNSENLASQTRGKWTQPAKKEGEAPEALATTAAQKNNNDGGQSAKKNQTSIAPGGSKNQPKTQDEQKNAKKNSDEAGNDQEEEEIVNYCNPQRENRGRAQQSRGQGPQERNNSNYFPNQNYGSDNRQGEEQGRNRQGEEQGRNRGENYAENFGNSGNAPWQGENRQQREDPCGSSQQHFYNGQKGNFQESGYNERSQGGRNNQQRNQGGPDNFCPRDRSEQDCYPSGSYSSRRCPARQYPQGECSPWQCPPNQCPPWQCPPNRCPPNRCPVSNCPPNCCPPNQCAPDRRPPNRFSQGPPRPNSGYDQRGSSNNRFEQERPHPRNANGPRGNNRNFEEEYGRDQFEGNERRGQNDQWGYSGREQNQWDAQGYQAQQRNPQRPNQNWNSGPRQDRQQSVTGPEAYFDAPNPQNSDRGYPANSEQDRNCHPSSRQASSQQGGGRRQDWQEDQQAEQGHGGRRENNGRSARQVLVRNKDQTQPCQRFRSTAQLPQDGEEASDHSSYSEEISFTSSDKNSDFLRKELVEYCDQQFGKGRQGRNTKKNLNQLYPAIVSLYREKNLTPPPYNFVLDVIKLNSNKFEGAIDKNLFLMVLLTMNGY